MSIKVLKMCKKQEEENYYTYFTSSSSSEASSRRVWPLVDSLLNNFFMDMIMYDNGSCTPER